MPTTLSQVTKFEMDGGVYGRLGHDILCTGYRGCCGFVESHRARQLSSPSSNLPCSVFRYAMESIDSGRSQPTFNLSSREECQFACEDCAGPADVFRNPCALIDDCPSPQPAEKEAHEVARDQGRGSSALSSQARTSRGFRGHATSAIEAVAISRAARVAIVSISRIFIF
jgi:hypothetical protein